MPASTLRKTALVLALATALGTLGCSESVESLVASGDAALAKGDYRTAEIQLKSALQKDGNNARARWLLGELNLTIEDGAAAEKEIRRAGELGVGNDAVIPALAQALLLQGKVDAVLELALPPDLSPRSRGEVMAAQGLALLVKGEKGRADELTAEALKRAPDSKFATTARVRVLIDANKLEEAEPLLTGLQQKHPDYGLAWSLMGEIKEQRGDLPKAEEAYTTAIAKRTNGFQDLLKRGFIRLRQEKLEVALADATQLTEALPRLQLAWYLKGMVHFLKKDFANAQEALDRSYQLNNDHLPTLILLGWSNLSVGNVGQASEQANRAYAIAPRVVAPRLLMATIDLREQRPQRAEEMVRPVVAAFPDNLPAKSLLTASLQAQGRAGEAVPLLEQIAAARPEALDLQAQVGVELLRTGQTEKALAVLERAVARSPEAPRPSAALVAALLRDKQFDEALAMAERLSHQNPDDILALRLISSAQVARGDVAAAEKTFRAVLRLAPGDVGSSLQLADLLERRNEHAEAKEILASAYARHPDDGGLTFVMSQLAAREGRVADARALLIKSVAQAPTNKVPRLILGRQLLAENSPQAALDALPKEPDSKDPSVLAVRAEARLMLLQFDGAKEDLERLALLSPSSAGVRVRLATVYERLGRLDDMERMLSEADRLDPNDPNIGLGKARALAARGKPDEARQAVAALGLSEAQPAVLETLLAMAERQDDKAERARLATALFAARPETQTVLRLAEAMTGLGDVAAAERVLRDWLVSHGDDAATALALARLLANSGSPQQAAEALRPFAKGGTDNVSVLNNLAWYLIEGSPAESLGFAEKAVSAAPNSPAVLDTYAMALAKNGQFENALHAIDAAIRHEKEPVYFRLQKIGILRQSGDKSKAAAELERLRRDGIPGAFAARADELEMEISRP